MTAGVSIYSEIGTLKRVLVHKPGRELENLSPEYLERLLFDDIPYMNIAREEHDMFVNKLIDNNVEVVYLQDLVSQLIIDTEIKEEFVMEFLKRSSAQSQNLNELKKYLLEKNNKELIETVTEGVKYNDLNIKTKYSEYPFLLDPMPNLYFTRDPLTSIGNKIIVNSMKFKARKRETIFGEFLLKYHTDFSIDNININSDYGKNSSMEGGDILILSKDTIIIGESERTDKKHIMLIAKQIFGQCIGIKKILIFSIPKTRAYMHLDTVINMIDYYKFVIYNTIEKSLKISELSFEVKTQSIIERELSGSVQEILSKTLSENVEMIYCGNGDNIASSREQWNDGVNLLTISPGKVIAYERNYITNETLDKKSIKVIPIRSSELSRGRGGPRCMSMPLIREKL